MSIETDTDIFYGQKPKDLVVENRIEVDEDGNVQLITSVYYVEGGQYYVHEPVEVRVHFEDLVTDFCSQPYSSYPADFASDLYNCAAVFDTCSDKFRTAAYQPEMALIDTVEFLEEDEDEFLDTSDYMDLLGVDLRDE